MQFKPTKAVMLLSLLVAAGCDVQQIPWGKDATFAEDVAPYRDVVSETAFMRNQTRQRPDDAAAFARLGDLYLEQGQYIEAQGVFNEALLLATDDPELLRGMAHALAGQGRFSEAHGFAGRIANGSTSAAAHMAIGVSLAGSGNCRAAMASFGAVLLSNPRDLTARTNMALCRAMLGDRAGYDEMRAVAYAPDAGTHHLRNLILVAEILGMQQASAQDAEYFGLDDQTIRQIKEAAVATRAAGKWTVGLAIDPDSST